MKELILEIQSFLDKHARKVPEARDGEIYTSPDAHELLSFKEQLERGTPPKEIYFPNSSWESCGYQPYGDREARAWHDSILVKIKKIRSS